VIRHDPLMRLRHVVHDDGHVLKPQVGAGAARRIRASGHVRELEQFDPLAAQPQQ
jgi:hypothetical protein